MPLYAQDQYKLKVDKIPAWRQRADTKCHQRWRANGHWQMLGKGESVFFKNVAPVKLTIVPWKSTHPGVNGKHQLYLVDIFFFWKKQSWVGRAGGFHMRGVERGVKYDQSTLKSSLCAMGATVPARHVHWWNSGRKVLGLTIYFLIGSKARSTR